VIFGQEADHSHFLSIGIIQSPICLQSQRRTAKTHSSDTIAEISLTAGLTINCPLCILFCIAVIYFIVVLLFLRDNGWTGLFHVSLTMAVVEIILGVGETIISWFCG